jgi:hypothetical protein
VCQCGGEFDLLADQLSNCFTPSLADYIKECFDADQNT